MRNPNKIFVVLLALITLILAGIFRENVQLIKKSVPEGLAPNAPSLGVLTGDVNKLKEGIEKAGLSPRDAKYWITIDNK